MTTIIKYGDAYLNPSKLLERLEELRGMKHGFDDEELGALEAVEDALRKAENNEGQLIRATEFQNYCEELCEDSGTDLDQLPWYIVIDWESTAENMRVDYTEVEIFGDTYRYLA